MHRDHEAGARIVSLATAGSDIDVQFFEVWTPLGRMDEVVDITDTVDAKVAAIRAYASQCRVMRFDDAFLGLARYRGEMFSWPDGDYAEVFVRGTQ
jgi:LmbE family N-acetylglucosaminyl deacetylase